MFGHSAGGQILHRTALFRPRLKARRIVAANAGFYTFSDRSEAVPPGLAGTGVGEVQLRRALDVELPVLDHVGMARAAAEVLFADPGS